MFLSMFKVNLYPNEWLLPTTTPFMWSFIAYFITRPKNDVEGYEMVINPHAQLQRGNQRAWHWCRSKTINPHLLSFLSFNNLVLESTRKKSFLSGNDLKYCPSFSSSNYRRSIISSREISAQDPLKLLKGTCHGKPRSSYTRVREGPGFNAFLLEF